VCIERRGRIRTRDERQEEREAWIKYTREMEMERESRREREERREGEVRRERKEEGQEPAEAGEGAERVREAGGAEGIGGGCPVSILAAYISLQLVAVEASSPETIAGRKYFIFEL
jgi:hypothetical protein